MGDGLLRLLSKYLYLSLSQLLYEAPVGLKKVILRQFLQCLPSDVFENIVGQFAGVPFDNEEVQLKLAVLVVAMAEAGHSPANLGFNAKLLLQFAL